MLTAILVASLYAVLLAGTSPRPSRISPRFFLALGAVSYPLYLLHQHIGYIAFNKLSGSMSGPVALLTVTAAIIALAALVWLGVEKPLRSPLRRTLLSLAQRITAFLPARRYIET
jgi:peptidoglycan/LPS O-acetylase OafA/YrhL